jgi:hypothetical protein
MTRDPALAAATGAAMRLFLLACTSQGRGHVLEKKSGLSKVEFPDKLADKKARAYDTVTHAFSGVQLDQGRKQCKNASVTEMVEIMRGEHLGREIEGVT